MNAHQLGRSRIQTVNSMRRLKLMKRKPSRRLQQTERLFWKTLFLIFFWIFCVVCKSLRNRMLWSALDAGLFIPGQHANNSHFRGIPNSHYAFGEIQSILIIYEYSNASKWITVHCTVHTHNQLNSFMGDFSTIYSK